MASKFAGGSGLFAATVQADIDDRMAKACEELVEIHRQRDIAAKKAAEEAKTNMTGNKNAKVYVNSAKRGTAIGKKDEKRGVAEDSDNDSSADEDDFLNDPELERIRLARIAKLKKLQVGTACIRQYLTLLPIYAACIITLACRHKRRWDSENTEKLLSLSFSKK